LLARVQVFRKFFPILAFLLLYQMARGMTLPLFPQYYQSINLSAIDIGIAFAAYGVSFLVFEALWGFIFERFGTKGTMPPLAIALTAVAILLFARPSTLPQLVGVESLLGLGLGGAGVFPRLAIAHMTSYADRGRAFGMLGLTYSIGATVGALLAGVSGSLIGVPRSFVLAGAICFASIIPVWLGYRSQTDGVVEVTPSSGNNPPPSIRLNKIGIIVLGMVGLIAAGGNGFFTLLLPNILIKEPGLAISPFQISIVIALYNLSTGLMQPFVGSLGSRKPVSWIVGCLVATGICYFAIIFAHTVPKVELITLFTGVVYAAITPLTLSLLTTFISRSYWGRIIGLYGAAEDVGIIIGSSLGSFVWGIWGYQYSFVMMGSIYALVGLTCFLAYRAGKLGRNSRMLD